LFRLTPDRPGPGIKSRRVTAGYNFDVSPEAIVDVWDFELSCQRFLGDAFPRCWPDFGRVVDRLGLATGIVTSVQIIGPDRVDQMMRRVEDYGVC
jgi:hypothetical protein